MKSMNIQMQFSQMRSESSECMWQTTGSFIKSWRIEIALELFWKICIGSFGDKSDGS